MDRLDVYQDGKVSSIYLVEQREYIDPDGLIQFSDNDLLRYFTTNDRFMMKIFINNHKFKISSNLYTALENKYKADFHISAYKIVIY